MIWLNSLICVDGKPIWDEKCYRRGLKTLDQLIVGSRFLFCKEAMDQYSLGIMLYNAIISAIPKECRDKMKKGHFHESSKLDKFVICKNPSKEVYKVLTQEYQIPNAMYRWQSEADISVGQITQALKQMYSITNVPEVSWIPMQIIA